MSLAYRLLAGVLVGLALSLGGFLFGQRTERNANEARRAEAQETAIGLHNAKLVAGDRVERAAVQRTVKTEAIFNGLNQGVTTYAQNHHAATDCQLDADGLRLWDAANAGADADSAGVSQSAVPVIADADLRPADGPLEQPRRRSQGLSPVPGSAPGAGQLAGER